MLEVRCTSTPQFRQLARILDTLILQCVASLPSADKIAFNQPVGCLDQLHDVDKLFECHDRKRDRGNHPGPEAVNLVGTSQL